MGFANTAMTLIGVGEVKALFSELRMTQGISEVAENTIFVTREGVALPQGMRIPNNFIENPFRSSNYGIMKNGKFIEKLRIDPATPGGMKGPNFSHYHLNGSSKHLTEYWPWPWW